MTYKNIEMEKMLGALEKHLGRTDLIGYAAARNTRILRSETVEYFERREQLIREHGTPEIGEDGNPTGVYEIKVGSKGWAEYAEEIEEWALIEHKPELYRIPASEVIGKLSGAEILEIDWMLEEE